MVQLTQMQSWKALERQAIDLSLRQNSIPSPFLSYSNITIDYKSQHIDSRTREMLFDLAVECQLKERIEDLFSGNHVNTTEDKPALHHALRASFNTEILVENRNIIPQIKSTLELMGTISNKIRSNEWNGYSGEAITDVINIGVGGSHLGPLFCLHALTDLTLSSLKYHFISDIDPHAFTRVTKALKPETTLFIVSSKSFSTAETMYNLRRAIAWINRPNDYDQHFIAITAYPERAVQLGLKHVLSIWDWVGGRYSACSAINLITCIAIGFDAFLELLRGAQSMDEHFRYAPLKENLPVNLALLGIWTNNFLNIHQLLLLTYAQNLEYFTAYIQQLDMESNGKSIDKKGEPVNYATGPIVWGGSGNHAQHSYYQLLHQGTHAIAADFISIDNYHEFKKNECLAQKEALSKEIQVGTDVYKSRRNKASITHIRLKDTSPKTIGALIALYEHKIYIQSVIWHINAFDQPGVESSKQLLKKKLKVADLGVQ